MSRQAAAPASSLCIHTHTRAHTNRQSKSGKYVHIVYSHDDNAYLAICSHKGIWGYTNTACTHTQTHTCTNKVHAHTTNMLTQGHLGKHTNTNTCMRTQTLSDLFVSTWVLINHLDINTPDADIYRSCQLYTHTQTRVRTRTYTHKYSSQHWLHYDCSPG